MKQTNVKSMMKKGLIRLLGKKKFIDITVTDLIKESGVARASFYRVYKNIDEVVDELVVDLRNDFNTHFRPFASTRDKDGLMNELITFFQREKNSETMFSKIIPENNSLLVTKIQELPVQEEYNEKKDIYRKYLTGMVAIGIIIILETWRRSSFKESPEEMAKFTFDIVFAKLLSI